MTSPSDLAVEMMNVVRTKIQQGDGDEQIRRYFVGRYGEWLLLASAFTHREGLNWLLWLGPPAARPLCLQLP